MMALKIVTNINLAQKPMRIFNQIYPAAKLLDIFIGKLLLTAIIIVL